MTTIASASISAENTFTTPVQVNGWFNVSVSGSFAGTTVTLQRSIDQASWFDVDNWTAAAEKVGMEPEVMWYRIGVKTGNYSAGPAVVRLGAEGAFRS